MAKPIRIVAGIPNLDDASSWYRGAGPLQRLHGQTVLDRPVEVTCRTEIGWSDLVGRDILYLQRPEGEAALSLAVMAMQCGLRIWCDWDDDIFAVKPSNPAYGDPAVRTQSLVRLASMAMLATVSTPALAAVYRELCPSTVIVPNSWTPEMRTALTRRPYAGDDPRTVIWWRGGSSHDMNLRIYEDALIDFIGANHHSVRLVTHGHTPHWIHDNLPADAAMHVQWSPALPEYFARITEIRPDIALVLHAAHPFEAARFPGTWLEGSLAGAVCVQPRHSAYDGYTDSVTYEPGDPEDMHRALMTTVDKLDDCRAGFAADIDRHLAELASDKTDAMRLKLVSKLMALPARMLSAAPTEGATQL